jgi:hypothetical protein
MNMPVVGDLNDFYFTADNSQAGVVDHSGIAWVSGNGGTRGAQPIRLGEFTADTIGVVGTTVATETITIVHEGFLLI